MISKKSITAYRVVLGAFLLTAFMAVGCNNGTEKKEPVPDTPKVSAPAAPVVDTPAEPIDTSKMKEASTRPVKTTD
jgi:hypothetical protein